MQDDSIGDPAVARVAAAQYGVVTRGQLVAAGLGRGAIGHRIKRGRLHRVHRGVYLLGHAVPPPLAREMAAVLAVGDQAVLSHHSAGSLWGLRPAASGDLDVTVVGRNAGRRRRIRLHVVRRLDSREIRRFQRLPVTAPARTLLDLAEVLSLRELERAVEEAQVRNPVRHHELRTQLELSPGRHGAAPLAALLDRDVRPSLTRSEAERRLLDLLRAAELPPSRVNSHVGRYEVDFLWLPQRLIVEMDGYRYHASRRAFERDRLRDAELQAAGYRVMRVTWRQVTERPEAVVARIAQALVLCADTQKAN
jgi:very-short-patch-repair endonuclease